jgi:VWFA-related protein
MTLLTVLCLWQVASLQSDKPQEIFKFQVEVRRVYVDVFVTRGGKSVTGLTAQDFELLDSGVPQQIELADVQSMPMSAMLLLDTSGSVYGRDLNDLRSAAHAFIDRLRQRDEAGVLAFSYEWQLLERPSSDPAELKEALTRPVLGGPTCLYDAIYAGMKLLEARQGRPLILVFTDGHDNASRLSESELLDVVKGSEVVIHVVGIKSAVGGSSRGSPDATLARTLHDISGWIPFTGLPRSPAETPSSSRFLETLTRTTGGRVWYADSSKSLKRLYVTVLEDMENRYLLSYEPQRVPEGGWHPLRVTLKGRKSALIRARPGYQAAGRQP